MFAAQAEFMNTRRSAAEVVACTQAYTGYRQEVAIASLTCGEAQTTMAGGARSGRGCLVPTPKLAMPNHAQTTARKAKTPRSTPPSMTSYVHMLQLAQDARSRCSHRLMLMPALMQDMAELSD